MMLMHGPSQAVAPPHAAVTAVKEKNIATLRAAMAGIAAEDVQTFTRVREEGLVGAGVNGFIDAIPILIGMDEAVYRACYVANRFKGTATYTEERSQPAHGLMPTRGGLGFFNHQGQPNASPPEEEEGAKFSRLTAPIIRSAMMAVGMSHFDYYRTISDAVDLPSTFLEAPDVIHRAVIDESVSEEEKVRFVTYLLDKGYPVEGGMRYAVLQSSEALVDLFIAKGHTMEADIPFNEIEPSRSSRGIFRSLPSLVGACLRHLPRVFDKLVAAGWRTDHSGDLLNAAFDCLNTTGPMSGVDPSRAMPSVDEVAAFGDHIAATFGLGPDADAYHSGKIQPLLVIAAMTGNDAFIKYLLSRSVGTPQASTVAAAASGGAVAGGEADGAASATATSTTPLHVAHQISTLRALLEAGLDPNATDTEGLTPLHTCKTAEALQLLLNYGGDINQPARKGSHASTSASASPAFVDDADAGGNAVTPLVYYILRSALAGEGAPREAILLLVKAALEVGATFHDGSDRRSPSPASHADDDDNSNASSPPLPPRESIVLLAARSGCGPIFDAVLRSVLAQWRGGAEGEAARPSSLEAPPSSDGVGTAGDEEPRRMAVLKAATSPITGQTVLHAALLAKAPRAAVVRVPLGRFTGGAPNMHMPLGPVAAPTPPPTTFAEHILSLSSPSACPASSSASPVSVFANTPDAAGNTPLMAWMASMCLHAASEKGGGGGGGDGGAIPIQRRHMPSPEERDQILLVLPRLMGAGMDPTICNAMTGKSLLFYASEWNLNFWLSHFAGDDDVNEDDDASPLAPSSPPCSVGAAVAVESGDTALHVLARQPWFKYHAPPFARIGCNVGAVNAAGETAEAIAAATLKARSDTGGFSRLRLGGFL